MEWEGTVMERGCICAILKSPPENTRADELFSLEGLFLFWHEPVNGVVVVDDYLLESRITFSICLFGQFLSLNLLNDFIRHKFE